MEKDPELEALVRSVRQKPEVRLPCADCGQLLYLTVPQCPHCRCKSVIKKCGWCHRDMRLFFSLAARQEYCQECEWKLSREALRCAHCGKRIAMNDEYVTFAQRILHAACLEPFQAAAPSDASSEEAQVRAQMDAARRQMQESATRVQAGPPPVEAEKPKTGCAAAVVLALLSLLASGAAVAATLPR